VDGTRAHQGCGKGTTCARGWRSGAGGAPSDGTSADDGLAPAFDYEHGALVVGIEAQMAVCSITWSSDESMVVAAGWQGNTARAWHVPSGMSAHALAPLQRMVSAVEWLPGHWLCAGGGGDEVILLWDIEPGAAAGASSAAADPVARLATGGRTVVSLSCSSDGKQLVALLSGQVLRVFDLDRITRVLAQQRSELQSHGGVPDGSNPNANDAGGDSAAGAVGPELRNDACRLLQSEMGGAVNGADEVMQEARGADGPVTHGLSFIDKTVMNVRAVRGDGRLVMGPSQQQRSKAIDYLDASPYSHVRVFECLLEISEPVPSLSYISSVLMPAPVPRDRVLLSCVSTHGEPMVVEWDTNSHQIVQTFRGHRMQRFVSGIAAGGPGEALVCAGGDDGRVILWQRQTGRPVKVLLGHQGAVNALSWCHWDSVSTGVPYLLASASDDHTVRIWGPRLPPPRPMQKGMEHSDAGLNGLMAKLCH
jgi:WD40 repeat protein